MPRHHYERQLRPHLERVLADQPAVFVAGPRQAGKTTLALEVAGGSLGATYWTLDDALARSAAREDPEGFVDRLETPAVIDEVQRVPELLIAIKRAIDRARRQHRYPTGMFLLTGSSNVWTTLAVSEALVGRVARLVLWPLTQREIEGVEGNFIDTLFQGKPPQAPAARAGRPAVASRIVRGGYPAALLRTDARDRGQWFGDYVDTILERDVREIANIRALDELPNLLRLVASRSGGVLNVSGIARDLGLAPKSTQRYLDLLKAVFLVFSLPAFKKNIGQRVIKGAKLYTSDTGLMAHQLGFDARRFESDNSLVPGLLFETFVVAELVRQAGWAASDVRPFHYRDVRGSEVDVVIENTAGEVIAVEAKLSSSIGRNDLRGLKILRDGLGSAFKAGAVLHTGSSAVPFGDRLWAVPVSALWTADPDTRPAQ